MFFWKNIRFILSLALIASAPTVPAGSQTLSQAMTEQLACYPVELVSLRQQRPSISRRELCLAAIYQATGGKPLWVGENGPTAEAAIIMKYLKGAVKEGLQPRSYQVEEIEKLWHQREESALAILDTLLTFNLVKYIHDVSHGRLKPYMIDPQLFAEAGETSFDPVAMIQQVLQAPELDGYLRSLPPGNVHYRGLRRALARYRLIDQGKWTEIAGGPSIHPGDVDQRIPLIRIRLAILDGRQGPERISAVYDDDLREGIVLFQERHGLERDGIIGKKTLAELNVSPAERIARIEINMARWRWQDHELGTEYILVNIAEYRLYGYRGGELQLSLPVIVGKRQHQTPVFSDRLQYVEFYPFWNIPPSIAMDEELPQLRSNPRYLAERNIRLFSGWQGDAVEIDSTGIDWQSVSRAQMAGYKLRQDPGPANALGRIKFVFPNHHSVYMHDTPAKNLFAEHERFFSHGCIRVSEPEKLALFVLQDGGGEWDAERIAAVLGNQVRSVVRVRPPLGVHITYQTAWLDKDDRIHFNRDIYDRDEKLQKALLSQ